MLQKTHFFSNVHFEVMKFLNVLFKRKKQRNVLLSGSFETLKSIQVQVNLFKQMQHLQSSIILGKLI